MTAVMPAAPCAVARCAGAITRDSAPAPSSHPVRVAVAEQYRCAAVTLMAMKTRQGRGTASVDHALGRGSAIASW